MIQSQIITKTPVDKTFSGVECYVVRTIKEVSILPNFHTIFIRTDFAQKHEDGTLTLLENKHNTKTSFTNDEMDSLFDTYADDIDFNPPFSHFNLSINEQMLLGITKNENPFGYGSDKWEILLQSVEI
tara:strand:+ start:1393 stop:1776 length:384 start_codon:yes stop_codon:yes gene_type:complete